MNIKLSPSIEVDSLKLRIPISQIDECKVTDILNPHLEVSELTGEVTKVKNKGHRIVISEGVVIHVDIKSVKTAANKPPVECLIILLNSKQLGARYFEGITPDNLQLIYNNLMSSGLFKFSWKTFIEARCTDVDFKLDEVLNRSERIALVKSFYRTVLPKRTDSVKAFIPRNEENNEVGVQFNYRERATNAKPFFKIYSKGAEAQEKDAHSVINNEAPFFDTHFNYKELRDICRIECTVKSNSMARAIGLKSMMLGEILHYTQETKVKIFQYMFSKYLSTEILKQEAKPKDTKITPSDIVKFNAMVLLIKEYKLPVESIIEALVRNIESKKARSRMRIKLNGIYEANIEGTNHDQEEAIKKVGLFLAKLGLV